MPVRGPVDARVPRSRPDPTVPLSPSASTRRIIFVGNLPVKQIVKKNDLPAAAKRILLRQGTYRFTQRLISRAQRYTDLAVRVISEFGTTIRCVDCGARNNVGGSRQYECLFCGRRSHRDLAGAWNILCKGLHEFDADADIAEEAGESEELRGDGPSGQKGGREQDGSADERAGAVRRAKRRTRRANGATKLSPRTDDTSDTRGKRRSHATEEGRRTRRRRMEQGESATVRVRAMSLEALFSMPPQATDCSDEEEEDDEGYDEEDDEDYDEEDDEDYDDDEEEEDDDDDDDDDEKEEDYDDDEEEEEEQEEEEEELRSHSS